MPNQMLYLQAQPLNQRFAVGMYPAVKNIFECGRQFLARSSSISKLSGLKTLASMLVAPKDLHVALQRCIVEQFSRNSIRFKLRLDREALYHAFQ